MAYPSDEGKTPPVPEGYPFNGLKPQPSGGFDWGVLDKRENQYSDAVSVTWAIDFLNRKQGKMTYSVCPL